MIFVVQLISRESSRANSLKKTLASSRFGEKADSSAAFSINGAICGSRLGVVMSDDFEASEKNEKETPVESIAIVSPSLTAIKRRSGELLNLKSNSSLNFTTR